MNKDMVLVLAFHEILAIGFIVSAFISYYTFGDVLFNWILILIGIFYFNFTILLSKVPDYKLSKQ